MANAPAEYQVVTKTYDLIVWTAQHITRFPRLHRHSLGQRLDEGLNAILDHLIQARFLVEERAAHLQRANLRIERLRFQFRLARDLQCLTTKSFGHAVRCLDEIGRMVGGWLRAREARAS